jgi:hypothetical protein
MLYFRGTWKYSIFCKYWLEVCDANMFWSSIWRKALSFTEDIIMERVLEALSDRRAKESASRHNMHVVAYDDRRYEIIITNVQYTLNGRMKMRSLIIYILYEICMCLKGYVYIWSVQKLYIDRVRKHNIVFVSLSLH